MKNHSEEVSHRPTRAVKTSPPRIGNAQPGIPFPDSTSIFTVNTPKKKQPSRDEHPWLPGLQAERVEAMDRDRHGQQERDAPRPPVQRAGPRWRGHTGNLAVHDEGRDELHQPESERPGGEPHLDGLRAGEAGDVDRNERWLMQPPVDPQDHRHGAADPEWYKQLGGGRPRGRRLRGRRLRGRRLRRRRLRGRRLRGRRLRGRQLRGRRVVVRVHLGVSSLLVTVVTARCRRPRSPGSARHPRSRCSWSDPMEAPPPAHLRR
jgi:hypothetical protein